MCGIVCRTVKSTRQTFEHCFHSLASCSISFSSNNPGTDVPHLSRLSIYCDGQIRSLLKKFIPKCQPACAQQARGTALQNTTVNISELLKAIQGRHSYFICMSSYLAISLRLICPWCKKGINIWIWKDHTNKQADTVSITKRWINKRAGLSCENS